MTITETAEPALAPLTSQRPDVVIMDLRMLGGPREGLHRLKRVKERPETEDIRVVIPSTLEPGAPPASCMRAKPYLVKPMQKQNRLDVLRSAVVSK